MPGFSWFGKCRSSDVLVLVPFEIGADVAARILDRLDDPDDSYQPSAPPCIVQFAFDEGRYIFQRVSDARNGIPDDGNRDVGLGAWFSGSSSIKVRPKWFAAIKAESAFMDDPPDKLYLATLLWSKVFPLLEATSLGNAALIEVRPDDLANEIRRRYRKVRASNVRASLGLLEDARLARPAESGGWHVAWQRIARTKERDIAKVIAERACSPPGTSAVDRLMDLIDGSDATNEELRLFD